MSIDRHVPVRGVDADPRRWRALAVVLLAVFMDLVDISVVVIAAPAIRSDLGTGYAQIQWVIAAYSLALGLLLITGGRLGDVIGRRRAFACGVAVFTLASAACGLAPTIDALIAARVVQGAAAALMVPQVLATIQVGFPAAERPKAFALYGALNAVAASTAPIIGGLLLAGDVFGLGWRAVFWMNVPIGVVAMVGAVALMPESRSAVRPRFDLVGVLLVSVALSLVLLPLVQGPELGWPLWTLLALAGSIPALAVFARHQARQERVGDPVVPLSLLRRPSFAYGLATALVLFSSIAAMFLVLTVMAQTGHGFAPLTVGLVFTAFPAGLALSSAPALRLAASLGRRLIATGAGMLAAAMVVLIATVLGAGAELAPWQLVPGLLLGGLGFGLIAPVVVGIVLSQVPAVDAGAASGVTNTVIQVAAAAGIAALGAPFTTVARHGGDLDTAAVTSLAAATAAFLLGLLLTFGLPDARGRARPGGPSTPDDPSVRPHTGP